MSDNAILRAMPPHMQALLAERRYRRELARAAGRTAIHLPYCQCRTVVIWPCEEIR